MDKFAKQHRHVRTQRAAQAFGGLELLEDRRLMSVSAILPVHPGPTPIHPYNDDFQVTNTNDQGAGSFRQAILNADADTSGRPIVITFGIGSGAQTITPNSMLPAVTKAMIIDAETQPGYTATPLITLNGQNVPAGPGINVDATGAVVVEGFSIQNMVSGTGISFQDNGGTVTQNVMGRSGSPVHLGISVYGGESNIFSNNTIEASGYGIFVTNSDFDQISSNTIIHSGNEFSEGIVLYSTNPAVVTDWAVVTNNTVSGFNVDITGLPSSVETGNIFS
jgi:parallel beta-helix repeat protein